MEFDFKTTKPDTENIFGKLTDQTSKCEFQVKLDLNDIIVLLSNNKDFNKFYEMMKPICCEMKKVENDLLITINGSLKK